MSARLGWSGIKRDGHGDRRGVAAVRLGRAGLWWSTGFPFCEQFEIDVGGIPLQMPFQLEV
jgi:hypothetical protein